MGHLEKAVVFEGRKVHVRCDIDQIKTTKDHHYQQFARNDLLFPMFFTLDTSHLLMSALNEEASANAVEFGGRKKKG